MSRFSAHFSGHGFGLLSVAALAMPAFTATANPARMLAVSTAPACPQLIAAANLLCRQAMADDPYGDFGTREECVAEAINSALARPAAQPATSTSTR